jgi:hypothetical protein
MRLAFHGCDGLIQWLLLLRAPAAARSRPAPECGGAGSLRTQRRHEMRCIWHVCAVRKDGKASRLAPADQGSTTDKTKASTTRSDTNQVACPFPTLHSSSLRQDQLSGCSLCTASARPSEAHHNLDVLPRGIHPCCAAPLAASRCLCVGGYLD